MAADTYNDHPGRLQTARSYRPEFVLINWSSGSVVGCGDEEECRSQLEKVTEGTSVAKGDTFAIAEVKVLSELKRIET
jgi:hypothetical protein